MEPIYVTVDTQKNNFDNEICVTQNDTAIKFVIKIQQNGKDIPLPTDNVYLLTSLRMDNVAIISPNLGLITGINEVTFHLGAKELEVQGLVRASVQIINKEGRLSTLSFNYSVFKDLSNVLPTTNEKTLIEIVLNDGPIVIEDAKMSSQRAEEAAKSINHSIVAATEVIQAGTKLFEEVERLRGTTEKVKQETEVVKLETSTVKQTAEKTIEDTLVTRVATEKVKKDTEVVKEATEQLRVGMQGEMNTVKKQLADMVTLKSEMELVKSGTETVKSDTEKVRKDTLIVKEETNTVKNDVIVAKNEIERLKNETITVKNETEIVRKNTETLRLGLKGDIDSIKDQLNDSARQTTIVTSGTSIVNGGVDTLVDVEVEGRTLGTMINSNLEAGKKYVLADKKTKIVVDGQTVSGVGKFTKGSTTVTKADFVGKASGSNVANPHRVHQNASPTLQPPTGMGSEVSDTNYNRLSTLNGTLHTYSNSTVGVMVQQFFVFNIVEQIERTLGLIPRTTLAEKIQWVKENTERIEANWIGNGSGVGGNKASFLPFMSNGSWKTQYQVSHTSSIPQKLTVILLNSGGYTIESGIDSSGTTHFVAYAEVSDGTIPSIINTDSVDVVITLKPTAQLNTRPRIIRVANFEGKVAGSTVENPHRQSYPVDGTTRLLAPSEFGGRENTATSIQKLDGTWLSNSQTVAGGIGQKLFSFNLIEEVERNIGKIPRSTVADKVAWLRNNLYGIRWSWWGFGSSPTGNKASWSLWNPIGATWGSATLSHTHATVGRLINGMGTNPKHITDDGFIHLLAHAEPSDGTTPSVINTDYVELEIEMLENADFTNPKVPLYEVSDTEYSKILVDWNADEVINRYPVVEGVQHIQGLSLTAEGENLLPPFTEWESAIGTSNHQVEAPYSTLMSGNGYYLEMRQQIKVLPSTTYNLSLEQETIMGGVSFSSVLCFSGNTFLTEMHTNTVTTGKSSVTFTTPANCNAISIRFGRNSVSRPFSVRIKNPMLTLGSQPKPFVPRNPSSLLMDVKLGKIGNVADMVYEQDGRWMLRKAIEKDVVLEGSLGWFNYASSDSVGHKGVLVTNALTVPSTSDGIVIDNQGTQIPVVKSNPLNNKFRIGASSALLSIYASIPNDKTGFNDMQTVTNDNWKRYFNGWKYTDGTTWTSVTGNGQTATGQQALDTKPTDYTPYKLSYSLATPVITDVTDKVEGQLVLNGQTQINIDSGYRRTLIDGKSTWIKGNKVNYTSNPTNVKLIFANNIRNSLEDTVMVVQDNTTRLSVHEKAIVDLYVRVKALEVR